MNDYQKLDELNTKIDLYLGMSMQTDNPFTSSEYRALMHQIDRLTIKRDLLLDRINLFEKNGITKDKISTRKAIIISILMLLPYTIIFIYYLLKLHLKM